MRGGKGRATFLLRSRIPVRMPSPAIVPQGNRSLPDLRRQWDESRDWFLSCVTNLGPAGVHRAGLEHPVVGPMTAGMAIRMGQVHVDGHVRQIRARQRLPAG